MPFIVISGPERAGKTTVCDILRERHHARVRHHGPVDNDWAFLAPLISDLQVAVNTNQLVVWDRSWICESVYAKLMDRRHHRSYTWPWAGHWFYGRAVQTIGVNAVLLGPSIEQLKSLRTDDDLPVPVELERFEYAWHGATYGALVVENQHTTNYAVQLADKLAEFARTAHEQAIEYGKEGVPLHPPMWAGPVDAAVVFVGEALSKHPGIEGAWLPMTSRYGTMLGEALDPIFMGCAWTNVEADCERLVLRIPHAVALGRIAADWLTAIKHPDITVASHPSAVYRWGKFSEIREQYGRTLENFVRSRLEASGGNRIPARAEAIG